MSAADVGAKFWPVSEISAMMTIDDDVAVIVQHECCTCSCGWGWTTGGLPVESSSYTQYKDLEDYKKQGYGIEGHQQPVIDRAAASSTDAPTNTPPWVLKDRLKFFVRLCS
nr:Late embryogenesis abundant protein, LEA-18 [Ipomoea batatas]